LFFQFLQIHLQILHLSPGSGIDDLFVDLTLADGEDIVVEPKKNPFGMVRCLEWHF
jgi:hypothetical protein